MFEVIHRSSVTIYDLFYQKCDSGQLITCSSPCSVRTGRMICRDAELATGFLIKTDSIGRGVDSAECIQYDETVVAPQNSFETGPAATEARVENVVYSRTKPQNPCTGSHVRRPEL